jgi:hypothetical protein
MVKQYCCAVCHEPVSDDKQELEKGVTLICANCIDKLVMPFSVSVSMLDFASRVALNNQLANEFEQSFIMFN